MLYLVAYGIGYVLMFPRIFRYMLNDLSYGTPDKEDIFFSGWLALLITLFWPFVLLWLWFDRLVLSRIVEHIQREYRR